MKYNTTIKDKNSRGYFVDNTLFVTLHQAEIHCNKFNINPNIIVHDLEKAKECAMYYLLPMLDEMTLELEKMIGVQLAENEGLQAIINSTSPEHRFDKSYASLKATENIGKVDGLQAATNIVFSRKQELLVLLHK